MSSAWDDPRSRAHVAAVRRGVRWAALASVLLVVLLAVLAWRAQVRADRLATAGVPAQAVVLDRYARGKSHFVALRVAGQDVEVRVGGTWSDPYAGYRPGEAVAVRHDPQDPTDLRTAADWNTPGAIVVPGVLGAGLLPVLAVGAAVGAVHARRLRARLERSTWAPVPVAADGTVEGAGVALTTWPVPRQVERLVPPQGRTEVLIVQDRLLRLRRPTRPSIAVAAPSGGGTGA